jgi:hypothetical protein
MQWSDISFKPTNRTLRQFAGFWIAFLGAAACWQGLLRGNTTLAIVFTALALTVGPLGLIIPQAIRWIYVGAMLAAFPIGFLLSRIVLTVLFYGVFAPVSLIFKLVNRDALGLKKRPDSRTYWTLKRRAAGPQDYFRQF